MTYFKYKKGDEVLVRGKIVKLDSPTNSDLCKVSFKGGGEWRFSPSQIFAPAPPTDINIGEEVVDMSGDRAIYNGYSWGKEDIYPYYVKSYEQVNIWSTSIIRPPEEKKIEIDGKFYSETYLKVALAALKESVKSG